MEVWSLGWEDFLKWKTANHSSILAWRIPWTKEPSGLHSLGSQRVRHNWSDLAHTHTHTHTQSKNIPGLFWNSDNGSELGTAALPVKRKGTSRKVCVMKGKQLCPPPLSKEGLFFFNWSIVDLQYYINFRYATQWFSIFIDYTPHKVIMGSALVVQWSGSRTLNSVSCQGNEIPQAALCSQK